MNPTFLDFKVFQLPENEPEGSLLSSANRGKVLVIMQCLPVQETELRAYLQKILLAVGLDLDQDAALLRIPPGAKLSAANLRAPGRPERIIAFGPNAGQLGLQFALPLYTPASIGGISYLLADELQEILEERQRGEKQRAAALWQALKEMFQS